MAEHKSPLVKSTSLSKITAQNYQAQKRARGDVQLKFVTPEEVDGAEMPATGKESQGVQPIQR